MIRKRKRQEESNAEYRRVEDGKSSQSPMAENVGDIDLHKGAGDDTDVQSSDHREPLRPLNRRAADINGVDWEEPS